MASHDAPDTPIVLPATRPTTTATVVRLPGEGSGAEHDPRVGQGEDGDHQRCWSTGAAGPPAARRASDGPPAGERDRGGEQAHGTPAMVAWTPDSNTHSHSATPRATYTGCQTTWSRRSATTASTITAAGQPGPADRVRVHQRDHQDRPDVVDDGEGQEEHLEGGGTRRPRSGDDAEAKAMSVAIGTPHPWAASVPAVMAKKSRAGTTMPPRAATAGRAAARAGPGARRPPTRA